MKEEDIPKLSNEEIQKIERITEAFKKREDARKNRLDAEANLESQKKWRTVFERAPKETIPFIIYVVYNSFLALGVLLNLLQYTDVRLWIGAFLFPFKTENVEKRGNFRTYPKRQGDIIRL